MQLNAKEGVLGETLKILRASATALTKERRVTNGKGVGHEAAANDIGCSSVD